MKAYDSQLKAGLDEQPLGSHICSIYKDWEEQITVVLPFIMTGIERREKVFYIIHENTAEQIVSSFMKKGINLQSYVDSGHVTFLTSEQAYLNSGSFDPDQIIEQLKNMETQALEEGYAGLRLTGEMSWVFSNLQGVERLVENEDKLNAFLPSSKSMVLCQYHEESFDPGILYYVLRTHPVTIIHGRLCENPYFLPHDESHLISRGGKVTQRIYERLREDIIRYHEEAIERSRVEEGLRRSEERFRFLIESSIDVITVVDAKGTVLYQSPNYETVWGREAAGEVGRDLFKDVHPDDIPKVGDAFVRLLKKPEEPVKMEIRAIRTDGTLRNVEAIARNHLENPAVRGIVITFRDITERKKAEENLRIEEQRFRAFAEQSSDLIALVNLDGVILYENPVVERFLGLDSEERVGASMFERLHPDDLESVADAFKALINGSSESAYRAEARLQAKDGSWHVFESVATKLVTNNVVEGVVVNLHDITERKRTEELMRIQRDLGISLSEAKNLDGTLKLSLEAAIQASEMDGGGIYLADVSSGALNMVVNKGFTPAFVERTSHYDADSDNTRVVMAGKPVYTTHKELDVFIDEDKEKEGLLALAVIPISYEGEIIGCLNVASKTLEYVPDFARRSLEVISSQIGSAIVGKRAEGALRESEEKYSMLVENATDGVTIVRDKAIIFANKSMSEMSGYTIEELIGMSTFDLVPPDFISVIEERFRLHEQGAELSDVYEVKMLCKDGTIKEMEYSRKSIEYCGSPAVISIARDVTERKRAEAELKERLKELECIADISRLSERPETTVEDFVREAVHVLPAAWQYPDICGARIKLDSKEFMTANFVETEWSQSADIKADEERFGTVTVSYLEEMPGEDEGPFLKEERALINTVADFLGHVIRQRQAEDALRESEAKQRLIFESIADGIVVTDMECKIKDLNSTQLRLFGYDHREDAIGENGLGFITERDRDRAVEDITSLLKEGSLTGQVWTFKDRWGKEFEGEISSALLQDADGNPTEFIGVVRDITERRRMEEALSQSEEKHRALLDQMEDGYIVVSGFSIKFANSRCAEMLGYQVEDIIGNDFRDFLTPEAKKRAKEIISTISSGKTGPQFHDFTYLARGGREVPIEFSIKSIIFEGDPSYSIVMRDITERKRAEAALRESEERYRTIFEATGTAAAIVEEDLSISLVNAEFERLFGYSKEELEGKISWSDFILEEDAERVKEYHRLRMIDYDSVPKDYELRVRAKNGDIKSVIISTAVIPDVKRSVAFITDITERKRTEGFLRIQRDLGISLGEAINLDETLNLSLEAAIQASEMDGGGIYLADVSSGALNMVANKGLTPAFVERTSHYDADSDNTRMVMAGKPVYTTHKDLGVFIDEDKEKEGLLALAVIPISYEGEIIGCLNVASKTLEYVPDFARRSLEVISSQIGSAIVGRRAEESLHESEELFRQITENMVEAVSLLDKDGIVQYASPSHERITGYKPEELVGKASLELTHPEDVNGVKEQLEGIFEKGEASFQYRFSHADGHYIWGDASCRTLYDDSGNVSGFVIASRDITERRRAEESLQESEQKLRTLFDNSPDIIMIIDGDGKILFINRTVPEMTIEDTLGRCSYDYISEEYRSTFKETVEQVFRTGSPGRIETRGVGPDNSVSWYESRFVVLESDEERRKLMVIASDVTERKQADEALRERDSLYQKLSQTVPGMIYQFVRRPDGTFCAPYSTEAIKEYLGCSSEDVREDFSPVARVILPEDLKKVINSIEYSAEHMTPWQCEYRVQIPGEPVKWLFGRASIPERLPDGSVVWYGFNTDITELVKVGEILRESEERYRILFEDSQDAVVITNIEGEILDFNRSLANLVGYSGEELLKLKAGQLYMNPGDREVLKQEITSTGAVRDYPVKWVRKDGVLLDVLMTLTARYDADGDIVGYHGIIRDVTERLRMEESMRESEELSRSMLDKATIGIYLLQDKKFTYVNPTFEKIIGYESEELVGHQAIDYVHPDDRDVVRTKAIENIKGVSSLPYEFRALRKDGRQIWIMERIAPIRYKGKRAVLASFMETTEHKRAQMELERAYEDLKTAHDRMVQAEKLRAMGEMASGIAHDFNNMLAVILGRTQLIVDDIADDKAMKSVKIIEQAALDAAKTVKRLQDFARIRVEHPFEPVDVNEVAEGVIKMVESRRVELEQTKGIGIKIEHVLGKVGLVSGDAAELREALLNILFNALDAMPTGGKLTVKSEQDEGWVRLTIKDTGVGIPDKVKEKVFQPFFTTKASKGSGLGLSVTYGIIARHNGMIKFDSEVGKGTTFFIKLPLSVESLKQEARKRKVVAAKPANILIVDDEPEVLKALGLTLEYFGHWVKDFTKGAEAIKAFKDGKYDLVITDLGMPEVSGWDVARAVKKMKPDVPVLLITGWVVDLDEEQEKIVDGVIAKPFSRDSISLAISKVFPAKKERTVKVGAVKKKGR